MANDNGQPTFDDIVKRLMHQTGITEAQALELIRFVGLNWPSLVREAKALKVGKS
ncbi:MULTISPECIES: hypothetical protein [unclassified Mesorhizobium]|uniref:hypothetical protein n=1 Tax=unclassified Mesorhizobium TaxID=325217 RepID=UPI0015E3D25B|nr:MULTISPECIES: hypothetical protein [unclassified Mesorhizobium]